MWILGLAGLLLTVYAARTVAGRPAALWQAIAGGTLLLLAPDSLHIFSLSALLLVLVLISTIRLPMLAVELKQHIILLALAGLPVVTALFDWRASLPLFAGAAITFGALALRSYRSKRLA